MSDALAKADREREAEATATPSAAATPTPTPTATPAPASLTACDANIRVRSATTTCRFAENVFLAYWMDTADPGVFALGSRLPAYSPAAGRTLTVRCRGLRSVICRGGDGALIRFQRSAVDAYNSRDAARYASSHDTGGIEPDASRSAYNNSGDSGDSGDYSDVVNCSDTQATDFPTPSGDPNGLDRDGDGIACES